VYNAQIMHFEGGTTFGGQVERFSWT